jgi:hypothetical protein
MKSFLDRHGRLIAAAVLGFLLAAGATLAQNKYRQAAQRGPYRVFLTKPIVGLGIKAGDLYREHELLGAVLNDLEQRGFVPLWTEVFAAETKELPREERLLVFCRKR